VDNFELIKDPEHGFYRVFPPPTQSELDDFYEQEFYAHSKGFNNASHSVQTQNQEFNDWQLSDVAVWVTEVLGQRKLDVLDVGCGYGHALRFFQDLGHNVEGIEPSSDAESHCRTLGLNVNHSNADTSLGQYSECFDLLLLNHVVEHVIDPFELLKSCLRTLRPGGLAYIEVPNDFSMLQDVALMHLGLEQWWVGPPRHLSYFNRSSLESLVSAAGFEIELVSSDFPLEFFLLFGENYIGDSKQGASIHARRVQFEKSFRQSNRAEDLRRLYKHLAEIGIGRQLRLLARRPISL